MTVCIISVWNGWSKGKTLTTRIIPEYPTQCLYLRGMGVWGKCNGKWYGDGGSLRRRHPRSESELTANLSNPARRLVRGPRVQMQREKIKRWGRAIEVIGRVRKDVVYIRCV